MLDGRITSELDTKVVYRLPVWLYSIYFKTHETNDYYLLLLVVINNCNPLPLVSGELITLS